METEALRVLNNNGYPILAGDVPQCQDKFDPDSGPIEIECGPVIIQNFDKQSLQFVSTKVSHPSVELMMLIHPDVYLLTPIGFEEVAAFAHYFCLMKDYMYTGVEAEIAYKGYNISNTIQIRFKCSLIALPNN